MSTLSSESAETLPLPVAVVAPDTKFRSGAPKVRLGVAWMAVKIVMTFVARSNAKVAACRPSSSRSTWAARRSLMLAPTFSVGFAAFLPGATRWICAPRANRDGLRRGNSLLASLCAPASPPGDPTSRRQSAVFDCDGQTLNRLFQGPSGNEHFELGVGRNIGASGTLCSLSLVSELVRKRACRARSRSKHGRFGYLCSCQGPVD